MYKILLVGRTSSGKDTIGGELIKAGLTPVVSYATRPPRENEGDTHIFISSDEADMYTDKVATTEINGYQYFATAEQVNNSDFYIIDPAGVYELTENMPDTMFFIINVRADEAIRKDRFIKRDPKRADLFESRNESENDQFTVFEDMIDSHDLGNIRNVWSDNVLNISVVKNNEDGDYKNIAFNIIQSRLVFTGVQNMLSQMVGANYLYHNDLGIALFVDGEYKHVSLDEFTHAVISDDNGMAVMTKNFFAHGGETKLPDESVDNDGISKERLLQILQDYVSCDAEVTETEYVRDMLMDICGCSEDEIRELGFSWMLDEIEEVS